VLVLHAGVFSFIPNRSVACQQQHCATCPTCQQDTAPCGSSHACLDAVSFILHQYILLATPSWCVTSTLHALYLALLKCFAETGTWSQSMASSTSMTSQTGQTSVPTQTTRGCAILLWLRKATACLVGPLLHLCVQYRNAALPLHNLTAWFTRKLQPYLLVHSSVIFLYQRQCCAAWHNSSTLVWPQHFTTAHYKRIAASGE